ncbi:MAG TPA: hypothetical protein VEA41_17535 [Salinarimonas sp.]|nr:hypothetical protein [Salinarimonas sp.]
MSLPHVLIGALLLAVVTLFGIRGAIENRPRATAHPPTTAALAFQREQAEAAARAEAVRRQAAAVTAVQQTAETEDVLPDGHGRAETFGYCTTCHNTAIIRRSHFPRNQWDDLMDWMTERHGMNPLEGEMRTTIVDYLARHFGPQQGPRGGRNPFLN